MESKVSEAWSVCFAKRIHHKNHAKSLETVLDSVCIGGHIGIHCRIAGWSVSEKWITSRVQINVFKLFVHWPVSNPDVASKSRRPIQLVREIVLESGSMCVPMVDLPKKSYLLAHPSCGTWLKTLKHVQSKCSPSVALRPLRWTSGSPIPCGWATAAGRWTRQGFSGRSREWQRSEAFIGGRNAQARLA